MSAKYEVRRVSSRQDRHAFIAMLWDLYAGDPNWVPPLIHAQKELVGFAYHPFYDENWCANFIVQQGARTVGRITAIVNHAHNHRYQEKRGFFGFFESIDDSEVSQLLFDEAFRYLEEEHGLTDVRGPINPSLNYELGCLIEGFDTPPTFMMTYNPPYYDKLISAAGFEKVQDLYAYEGHVDMIASLDPKLEFVIKEIRRRFNVVVRPFDPKNFMEEVRLFLDIYNKSLEATWGFVPLSDAEVAHQAKGLRHLLLPELTTVIEVDGKPIGAGLGLMDFNQIIKQIDGRLFPFGFLKLLTGKRKLDRVRLMSTNVLPEYQKWGFGLLALERMLEDILKLGVKHGEFSWVLESNHLSRASLERGGLDRSKTYRVYDKQLAAKE
ncbi:MAG: N-acetyltransferase [Aureliella sp.]